jgi:predicted ATPase
MTYFGWPNAHEDDAQRAIRTGLEIIEAVNGLDTPVDLSIRVGVATGPVVVGDSRGDDRDDAKLAVGETPNLAARIQGVAAADTVVIAESTGRLVRGAFELDNLGSPDLKGIETATTVYRVIGVAVAESRFEAAHAAGLTPLVGREDEVALFVGRWKQAKDGEGQAVLLSGEPGIGKSRITQELRERVAKEPHTRLRYQCSPYHSNSAFHPIIAQLERAAGFARDDAPETKLDKLEAVLGQATDSVAVVAPLIAAMLSLPIERYPPLHLSPQKQKDDTIAALADQAVGLAAREPVLMIFEDAHWSDPTTLEALSAIIDRIQEQRVLLVITYRPEFAPPWTGHGHVSAHTLNRLGRKLGAAMVANVTGGKALPADVLDQIVAKTDGIPLFVEELTKTVLEAGFLKEQDEAYVLDGPLLPLAIPTTLQDSLMARLDRHAPVKEVAQIAACIGREFSYELLAAVLPLGDNELGEALEELVASELVFQRGVPPDAMYTFKHALVQDAAYDSLLRSRRRQIHSEIATSIEQLSPAVVAGQPEVLAHHFRAAGNAQRAVIYWREAAKLSVRRSSYKEAIAHLNSGLKDLQEALRWSRKIGQAAKVYSTG